MSQNRLEQFEQRFLWVKVCEQLKCHNKGADRCIDTLNRLWRKNSRLVGPDGEVLLTVPLLTEEMVAVSLEQWELDRLVALNPPHQRDELKSFEPIVVLHWFDQDFLLDGNTRVNFWKKRGNRGPHAVLRIAEAK
jgi:hypothetical protein